MLFQTLDDKRECAGFYLANQLHINKNLPDDKLLTHTWNYHPALKDKNIEYAIIYTEGKSLGESCPPYIRPEYDKQSAKLKAIFHSIKEAKIDYNNCCLYDLLPEETLREFAELKNHICSYVFENVPKPTEYDFYRSMLQLADDISTRSLKLEFDFAKEKMSPDTKVSMYNSYLKKHSHIKYDIFRAPTGRLSTAKQSFPIFNMNKLYRGIIKPYNDRFIEIDINAAELRAFLALSGTNCNIKDDLYMWSLKHIFDNEISDRNTAKNLIISWLYDSQKELPKKHIDSLDKCFDKNGVKQKYWDGRYVKTIYSRKIESDEHHSINYISQSTFIDTFHRSAIKVNELLKNHKSFISFLLHDSCIIDYSKENKSLIKDIVKLFSETSLGYFRPNIKIGNNFGNMRKIN